MVELTSGSLLPGSTVYTCMLNQRGGTESDLTVSRLAPGTQASPLAPAFEGKVVVRSSTGTDVTCSEDWQVTGGQRSGMVIQDDYVITCHVQSWSGPGD